VCARARGSPAELSLGDALISYSLEMEEHSSTTHRSQV
jgi:hypothetical protein